MNTEYVPVILSTALNSFTNVSKASINLCRSTVLIKYASFVACFQSCILSKDLFFYTEKWLNQCLVLELYKIF